MKFYVTFGQSHVHRINNKLLHKDVVAELNAPDMGKARELAFLIFDKKFHQVLTEDELARAIQYFPDGIVEVY